jgi:DNA polymerase-1
MNLATRTVSSTEDLKGFLADYEQFGEFSFDIETYGTRKVRTLTLGELPKGTSRTATQMTTCPSCQRQFPPHHGRKWCSDVCRQAAEKDKPALDARTNAVWSISFAGPGRCDVIPCGHPDPRYQLWPDQVFEALEPLFFSDRRKINQNVAFDLLSVAKYYDGRIPPPPYADTQIMMFLLYENLLQYRLGALTEHHLGYVYSEKLGQEAYDTFFERAVRYSLIDAKMAWLLWWKFRRRVNRPATKPLFDLEMEVLAVLMQMRQTGAYVDVEEFRRLRPELEDRHKALEAEIVTMVGHPINLNSPQQLGRYLYDELRLRCPKLTDNGARSTDASVMRILARRNKAPRKILEFKDVQKMLSTYIGGYIPHIDDDSRIRASFNQARAKTGRLSCSDPNLQNIPARYKETFEATMVRQLFVAPPGKKLIVADYSQIELRILAHQTKDPRLLRAYKRGMDLHTQTASLIWKIPTDEVTPEQRSIAKNSNFNFAFEGGPGRVVEMSGIGEREAEKVYDAWHAAYPGVKAWGKEVKKYCWEHGYVKTLFGRKRHLPEIRSQKMRERSYAERQAVNHPIQGTAADIAKIAIVQVHEALSDFNAALVLQVHDEFVIEVDEEQVDEVLPLVQTAMEDVWLGTKPVLSVPLEVSINVGKDWADAK